MLSDYVTFEGVRAGDTGGLFASMYFLTVVLWMPNFLAMPRMDRPCRFALCTALHLAVCNGVGFLRRGVIVLRTLPEPFLPLLPREALASSSANFPFQIKTEPLPLGGNTGVCTVLRLKLRKMLGRCGAS